MSYTTNQPVLIGDLLVRSEMTTPMEMADAVPVSFKTGVPIGRVLVNSGSIRAEHLQQALLAQSLIRDSMLSLDLAVSALRIVLRENFSLQQALKIVGWQPEPVNNENKLGQLLLSADVIKLTELEDALRVYYSTGLPLARVLVRKGIITNLVAYAALSSQQLLRESKLSREQAVQAIKSSASSKAVIEDDYVNGYLRLCPANNLRLGELLILAKLVSEDALILAVETALQKGETLGEILVSTGLVRTDTMERALDAQRMVTKGQLDVAKAGDILRKANYERITVAQAVEQAAPAVLVSAIHLKVEHSSIEPPTLDHNRIANTMQDIRTLNSRKQRSHEETRARQLASRLMDKLEALHVRNNYLRNMVDREGRQDSFPIDLLEVKDQIELVSDFDDCMDIIDRLLAKIETCAYQNGFLRSRLDSASTETELIERLSTAEQAAMFLQEEIKRQAEKIKPTAAAKPTAKAKPAEPAKTKKTATPKGKTKRK